MPKWDCRCNMYAISLWLSDAQIFLYLVASQPVSLFP